MRRIGDRDGVGIRWLLKNKRDLIELNSR